MATKNEIQLNFNLAKNELKKMDEAATDLYKLGGRKLNDTLSGISHCWKGENATAFINKGNKLEHMMSQTALDIANILVDMRRVVDNIYRAEMNALDIANKRNY